MGFKKVLTSEVYPSLHTGECMFVFVLLAGSISLASDLISMGATEESSATVIFGVFSTEGGDPLHPPGRGDPYNPLFPLRRNFNFFYRFKPFLRKNLIRPLAVALLS